MKIRCAAIADAEAIATIQVQSWKSAYAGIVPDAYLREMNIQQSQSVWRELIPQATTDTLVAETETGLCGFINSGGIRDTVSIEEMGFDAEIHTLYVSLVSQRRGVGKALIHESSKLLRQRGLTRPVAWALTLNPWCSFYEGLGAKRIADKLIEIGGRSLSDTAFGWAHVDNLIEASALRR